jgi:hypothetical protein
VEPKKIPFTVKLLILMRADGTVTDPVIGIMHHNEVPMEEIVSIPFPKFSPNPHGSGKFGW